MAKLVGERKQRTFFRVVSTAFLVCCVLLLKLPAEESMKNKSEETSAQSDAVISTIPPEDVMVTEDPDSVETISKGIQEIKVKGIYVTGPVAGSEERMNELVDLVENTKLNAMVIDIKNDSGEITCKMDYDMAKSIHAVRNYVPDMKALISELKEKGIYLIARIVVFKDPILAESMPEYCIKNNDGTVFRDNQGLAWVNPYEMEVWKYVLNVAVQAANLGFDEIQFDYIRFPTASNMEHVTYGELENLVTKEEIITRFTKCVTNFLNDRGVKVSADVFGGIISSELDSSIIGQNYVSMAECLDCISPMVYPSQFSKGSYGIENPDGSPYDIVYRSLLDSQTKLSASTNIEVRPWLQDFTATWLDDHISYNAEQVKAQIEAVYASGYDEWILWNSSNHYSKEGIE